MGYYTTYTGQITIEPALSWAEFKDSPWIGDDHGAVKLDVRQEETSRETDEGTITVTLKTAVAIVPISEDSYKGYSIIEDVQKIVDAFPGHSWIGYISAEGEEAGDLWRLAVRDGSAVQVKPRIVWPEDAS
jgi:hypothetical protein